MSLLCKIGVHKWGPSPHYKVHTDKYDRVGVEERCARCGKVRITWAVKMYIQEQARPFLGGDYGLMYTHTEYPQSTRKD